jgi:hypothetical protein
MGIATWIAYAITATAVYLCLPAAIQAMAAGVLARLVYFGKVFAGNVMYYVLFGGLVAWFCIDLLWFSLEGGRIPIVALLGAFVFLWIHDSVSSRELNDRAKMMIGGESLAIIIYGVWLLCTTSPIRWY